MTARSAPALLVAIFLLLPGAVPAQGFKVPPTPDHYVTDNAGALSSDTRSSVENKLQAYERATGHQVIVWIGQTTGDVPLETWTGETAQHWRIGRKGMDDGAVLFLFMQDHKVRIEVGYGLESSLTDADAHRIVADVIVPRMKAGDPDGAVSNGAAAMLTTISPSYKGVTPPPEESPAESSGRGDAIFLFAILFVFFGFLIFMIVVQVVRAMRYGYLVMREGPKAARKDMSGWPAWGGVIIGGSSFGGGGFSGGGFGGGFSGGGGGFGGGGASGSW